MGVNDMQVTKRRWRVKGPEMEGMVARWYARLRSSGSQMEEYRRQAAELTEGLPAGAKVLEVAPGPGVPGNRDGATRTVSGERA